MLYLALVTVESVSFSAVLVALKEPLGRHAAAAGLSALSADASRYSGGFKRALRGCVTLQRRV